MAVYRQSRAVYRSTGEATASLLLVKRCVWKSRRVYGTKSKYMDSLCQCWAVYSRLQEVYSSLRKSIVSLQQSR